MTRTSEVMLSRAKEMRSEQTTPEARLWYHLRAKRLNGIKFTRQVVIGPYIADFVARSHKLIVEVDGDTHGDDGERDARRTAWLEEQGYRVIRFANAEVMESEEAVLSAILAALRTAPLPCPLPASGEREK